jgi:hypothetical protein
MNGEIRENPSSALSADRKLHMRIITLTSVAFAFGAFLRWVPFDYIWWCDIAGQLALATIISLLWRSFSLSRKIGLLIFAFFVGWFF